MVCMSGCLVMFHLSDTHLKLVVSQTVCKALFVYAVDRL
jgi:hypothetical protein